MISLLTSLALLGCHVDPPSMPGEDVQRRRKAQSAGRRALAQQAEIEASMLQAQQTRAVAAEALKDAEAKNALQAERERIAVQAAKKYEAALSDAHAIAGACSSVEWERVVDVRAELTKYVSEPRRDAALSALEPCRKATLKARQKEYQQATLDLREEFAVEIEDAFDENNPYSKGGLVATVKGDKLQVTMKGNFEGRKRHSQDQVDVWCERTALFTSIALRNSHGTFTCKPPRSHKEITATLLREANLLDPWVPPPPGDLPTPQVVEPQPPPVSAGQMDQLRADLAAADAALREPEAAAAQAQADADKARAAIRRIDSTQADPEQEWRNQMQESARSLNGAGVGVLVTGGVATGLGAYLAYLRIGTQRTLDEQKSLGVPSAETEDKLRAQTIGMGVGLAVGLPLVLTGALLIVGAKRRREAAQAQVAAVPGGLELRF
jgi:hypothetical protein